MQKNIIICKITRSDCWLFLADPSYPYQHFTSTVGGQVLAISTAEGSVVWEADVGSTVVAMYILQSDGLHRLPYTVIGKETLEEFVKVILSTDKVLFSISE